MIEKIVIENLVNRYLQYWQQSDIDGLMSMYDEEIAYHDMPSGLVAYNCCITYSIRRLLTRS